MIGVSDSGSASSHGARRARATGWGGGSRAPVWMPKKGQVRGRSQDFAVFGPQGGCSCPGKDRPLADVAGAHTQAMNRPLGGRNRINRQKGPNHAHFWR